MTTDFATLGAPEPLAAALAARGYDTPTPVQEAVQREDARGRDLMVSARTGSGTRCSRQKHSGPYGGPHVHLTR